MHWPCKIRATAILLLLLVGFTACKDDTDLPATCASLEAVIEAPDSLIVGQPAQINSGQPVSCQGATVTYTWALVAKPESSTLTLNNTNAMQVAFVPDAPGFYIFELSLRASNGTSASAQAVLRAYTNADTPANPVAPGNPESLVVLTGQVNENTVLTDLNGPGVADYVLEGTYTVHAKLVIGPGVEILAKQGASLVIEPGGVINTSAAIAGNPIVFAAQSQQAGAWCGIKILSNEPNQALTNVIVMHAGGNGCASLQIGADNDSGGNSRHQYRSFDVEKVVLAQGAGRGLVENSSLYLNINGLDINTHQGYTLQVGAKNAFSLNSTCQFNNGNYTEVRVASKAEQYLYHPSQAVLSKLPGTGHYLFLNDLVSNGNDIVIAPGVEVRFGQKRGWYHSEGNFTAVGTPNEMIVLRGQPAAGLRTQNEPAPLNNWAGVVIGNGVNALFEYVRVFDFGERSEIAGGYPRAGIALGGYGQNAVRHCIIGPGKGYGIFEHQNAELLAISNNVFNRCQEGNMHVKLRNIKAIKEGNQFVGNNGLDNLIRVRQGIISQVTFKSLTPGAGFRITGATTVSESLTIDPGANISFDHDAYFELKGSAQLNAVGTESQPINIFGGTSTAPATWPGFIINSANTNNTLQYVNISNGGGGSVNPQNSYPSLSNKANLMVTNNGYLNMQNCNISNSATVGVLLGKEATINADFLQVNTFENNAQGPSRRQE